MDFVEEFFEMLRQHGFEVFNDKVTGRGLEMESLERVLMGVQLTPQSSKNVRFIRSTGSDQFLYVLMSNFSKGFWGPDKNVINILAKQIRPWALVLLHGGNASGYWFSGPVVLSLISKSEWRVGKDGYSYKVNAPSQVARGEKFITPKKVLVFIAQLGSEAA